MNNDLKPAFSPQGYRPLISDYWCSKHKAKLKRHQMDKLRRKTEDDAGTRGKVVTCGLKLLA